MHQVATLPSMPRAAIAYFDRKLELLQRLMSNMSDVIDECEEFGDFDDDFDCDFDDDLDGDVVHDRYDELRSCVIDVEEIVAELRAQLGTSDGKVFP